jgi:uncharacterized membrane protein
MSVEVLFHASFGALGLLSGSLALWARKGSLLHRRPGTVFFATMMTTAASGAYLGFATSVLGNAIAGVVTIYLLTTSWMTIRRPEKQIGVFDLGAFLFAAAAAVAACWAAFAAVRSGAALLGGAPYMVIATIVAFAALSDLSVLMRRGLRGRQRVARHLWRMLLGFAAAVGSFFPGQLSFFPQFIQDVRPFILLFIPFFSVIAAMIGWLIVVLFTRWYEAADEKAEVKPKEAHI